MKYMKLAEGSFHKFLYEMTTHVRSSMYNRHVPARIIYELWRRESRRTCAVAKHYLLSRYSMHYENMPIQIYRKFHLQKHGIFRIKKNDIFHISAQNIDCGYLLEPPH